MNKTVLSFLEFCLFCENGRQNRCSLYFQGFFKEREGQEICFMNLG